MNERGGPSPTGPGIPGHPTRRAVLLGTAGAAGALGLAACSAAKKSPPAGAPSSTAAGGPAPASVALLGDATLIALVVGLENLAIDGYQRALAAARGARSGGVAPAVAGLVDTALSHHKDHAATWNSFLGAVRQPTVSGVDTTVRELVVDPGLAQVRDGPSLARFVLSFEEILAATYLDTVQNAFRTSAAIATAITIQAVEMQHAALLNFVLGRFPVPDGFARTDSARPASDRIG
jgi:hypothetical protein